jgi:hypothetical protein
MEFVTENEATGLTGDRRAFEPIIGRWQSSGTVLDESGAEVGTIAGTDVYEPMVGGRWILHHVDVMVGDDHVQALELIGQPDQDASSFHFRAFDASGDYTVMVATPQEDGSWHISGDGVRTTLWPTQPDQTMTAVWERQAEDDPERWVRWMDMRFARLA